MKIIYQSSLRVIGGSNDGRNWRIDKYDNVGSVIGMAKRIELSVKDFDPCQPVGSLADNHLEYYKIRCYYFSKDDCYYYLAPVEWTDKEAILFQFAK